VDIRAYTIADMRAELAGGRLWQEDVLPVSRHRAASQCANPRAKETDVILLTARLRGRLAAYLGVLPDRIALGGTEHRIGWLSTWWVAPEAADTGAGALLLFHALRHYGGHIGLCSFTPSAGAVFDASGLFRDLKTMRGIEVFVRSDIEQCIRDRIERRQSASREAAPSAGAAPTAPARPPIARVSRRSAALLLRAFSVAGNCLIDAWLALLAAAWRARRAGLFRRVAVEMAAEVDEEAERFREAHPRPEATGRGRRELNWILAHPWIREGSGEADEAARYAFSSVSRRFRHHAVKLRIGGELQAVLTVKTRDDTMSVPYCFLGSAPGALAAWLYAHARRQGVRRVVLFDPALVDAWTRLKPPCYRRKTMERRTLIARTYPETDTAALHLHDGDGDAAFT
jgi:hypothetical protein